MRPAIYAHDPSPNIWRKHVRKRLAHDAIAVVLIAFVELSSVRAVFRERHWCTSVCASGAHLAVAVVGMCSDICDDSKAAAADSICHPLPQTSAISVSQQLTRVLWFECLICDWHPQFQYSYDLIDPTRIPINPTRNRRPTSALGIFDDARSVSALRPSAAIHLDRSWNRLRCSTHPDTRLIEYESTRSRRRSGVCGNEAEWTLYSNTRTASYQLDINKPSHHHCIRTQH